MFVENNIGNNICTIIESLSRCLIPLLNFLQNYNKNIDFASEIKLFEVFF